MKMRNDFVSNSSSSSFIVNDIEKFYDKLYELIKTKDGNYDTWWLYGINVSFTIDNTEENRKNFSELLKYYSNDESKREQYVSTDLNSFIEIDKKNLDKLKSVRIYAYHDTANGNENDRLAIIYYAMKHENVQVVDAGEREITMFNDVPKKIVEAAIEEVLNNKKAEDIK